MERLTVIGGGGWGTALANLLALKGYDVDIWVRRTEISQEISEKRTNSTYLANVTLNKKICPSTDLSKAIGKNKLIFLVVPSHAVRSTARLMQPFLSDDAVVVSASKGLDMGKSILLTKAIAEETGLDYINNIACISGPNHAEEISVCLPSATVAASCSVKTAELVQEVLMTPYFRVYTNLDITGVELGGALKNIIAIGAGICDGLGFGDNTKAALMTRGLTEIARFGVAMGANALTFSGLAGIGDLIVTCTSNHSRNRKLGYLLGKGDKAEEIIATSRMVVEGYTTTKTVYLLSQKMGVVMPITAEIYKILYEGQDTEGALESLMGRNKKHEMEDLMIK